MIQIQDDFSNQNVSSSPVTNSDLSNQTISANQSSSTNGSSQFEPIKKKDNSAEIDKLLAELDKLSKNLDAKDGVEVKPEAKQEFKPVQEEPKASTSEEKFDFDAFLTDLEAKIDQESKKNGESAEMVESSEDFRKNRQPAEVQSSEENADQDEMSSQKPEEIPESSENSEISDNSGVAEESEDLKAQNIFDMLGLANISDEEKNQFLDELEEMIWDDFVVHDLELLLTSEEYKGAREILDETTKSPDDKKEALITYLEKLIPDLDEVLYDKALELKSEMMGERLNKMKSGADDATLAKIKEAEEMISQNHWKSAASLLNQLS